MGRARTLPPPLTIALAHVPTWLTTALTAIIVPVPRDLEPRSAVPFKLKVGGGVDASPRGPVADALTPGPYSGERDDAPVGRQPSSRVETRFVSVDDRKTNASAELACA